MVKHFKPEKKYFSSSASFVGVEKKSHSTIDFEKNIKNMHDDELADLHKQQETQIRMMQYTNWMMKTVLAFAANHQGDVAVSFVRLLSDLNAGDAEKLSDIRMNINIVSGVAELALGYQGTSTLHPFADHMAAIRDAKMLADGVKATDVDLDGL